MKGNLAERLGLTWRRLLYTFGAAAAAALAVFWARGGFAAREQEALLGAVCDALFVPGTLLLCGGLLRLASRGGAFDAITYGSRKALMMLRKEEHWDKLPKTYYDYTRERAAKERLFPGPQLILGGALVAASVGVLLARGVG